MTKHFRLAHISDLHFSKPLWSPSQFLSKRWIGNANLLLRRIREFQHDKVFKLIDHFQNEKVDCVLVSGDLSTTSLGAEFEKAKTFLQKIQDCGIDVITLPGNHDHYTKKDFTNQTFYKYFPSSLSQGQSNLCHFNLKDHKVAAKQLSDNLWIIAMDTALSTPLLACHGNFSHTIENHLRTLLAAIADDAIVILANHFPIFTSDKLHKHLVRDEALRQLLSEHPKIKFYLHGHTHRHSIADLRNAGLPIVVDSGCTAHEEKGAWNLLEFEDRSCTVTAFRWSQGGDDRWNWRKKTTNGFDLL